jgi:ABC-type uncharacterized transport system substrate-binding protein
MKIRFLFWITACVLAAAVLAAPVMAADAASLSSKKVVVISGVSKESSTRIGGYPLVYEGINEGFKAVGITPEYLWVELDSAGSDENKTKLADEVIAKARALKPDLIITLNDDALKFVGARIEDIPVVFTWIFGAPGELGMPMDNVTGVIRASYAKDIWTMARNLLNVKTVALMSKKSASMEGIRKGLFARADQLEKDSGVRYKEMYLMDTFEEWEKQVKSFPEEFIYLADTSRIVKDGKELTRQELSRWTVDNAKVPVVAASEVDVEGGALFSIVVSEKAMGNMAAESGMEILKGSPPAQVYKMSKKGKLVINAKTAQKLNVKIPYDILSTAEKIYE